MHDIRYSYHLFFAVHLGSLFSCLILMSPASHLKNPALQDSYHIFNQDCELVSQLPILSVISIFYNAFRNNWLISQLLEGMQAGVGAVIASVTVDMGLPIIKEKDPLSLVIMVGAFIAACVFSINVVYIVLTCGIIGVIRTLLSKRRSGK